MSALCQHVSPSVSMSALVSASHPPLVGCQPQCQCQHVSLNVSLLGPIQMLSCDWPLSKRVSLNCNASVIICDIIVSPRAL